MRKIHMLILGIETPIGQTLLKEMKENFGFLQVAVPSGIYPDDINIPSNLINVPLDNRQELTKVFENFIRVVVSCSEKYSNETIFNAAKDSNTKFIDAQYSYPQAVIEASLYNLAFNPTKMHAYQSASGIGIRGLWILSHQKQFPSIPHEENNEWIIEKDSYHINDVDIKHYIYFSNKIFAMLFYVASILLRIIFPFGYCKSTYSSICNWKFEGETVEHKKRYSFSSTAVSVDANYIRPDLVILHFLKALGVNENESADWRCFKRFKLQLKEYTPINENNE